MHLIELNNIKKQKGNRLNEAQTSLFDDDDILAQIEDFALGKNVKPD